MTSDYTKHAQAIIRLTNDPIKMIDRLIKISSPIEYFDNVNNGTEILKEQYYRDYYKLVKQEIERITQKDYVVENLRR
jgi:hypothetical protein